MTASFDPDEFLSDLGIDGDDQSPAIKQLRKKLKELGNTVRTLSTENENLKTSKAKEAVADTWKDLKVPEVIQGFYKGDETPDAIKSWWESSKGFFNIQSDDTSQAQAEPQNKPELEAVQRATALGQDQGNGSLNADALRTSAEALLKTRPSNSPQALADWLNENGLRTGAVDVAS